MIITVTIQDALGNVPGVEVKLRPDPGANFTWVPRAAAERAGLHVLARREFRQRNGTVVERNLASAIVRYEGTRAGITVGLAEEGDPQVLGAIALLTLGLTYDPRKDELKGLGPLRA